MAGNLAFTYTKTAHMGTGDVVWTPAPADSSVTVPIGNSQFSFNVAVMTLNSTNDLADSV